VYNSTMSKTNTENTKLAPLVFTDAAAAKVKSLIDEEENPTLNLRVFITGGGCSGFQYGFTFDETINPDDTIIEKQVNKDEDDDGDGDGGDDDDDGGDGDGGNGDAVKLLVDSLSLQYLKGAEIDYREDINGAQFIIRNPNAKTTCGCGSSFST